tara:strand:+ start:3143 stop:4039 length:897 start_codon:yes stop_codon:yes gene_type:complete
MYKKNKVIPIIFGGLGNQLFIYAAAKRLSILNNADLILDDKSGFVRDFQYKRSFQLDNFNINEKKLKIRKGFQFFSRVYRFLIRLINSKKSFNNSKYITQNGMDFEPRLMSKKIKNYLYLIGYWQSEDYFKDIEEIIRKDLVITPPFDRKNLETFKCIENLNSVAIHYRFFDNPDISSPNNATKSYYLSALKYMERVHPDAHYYVFSDKTDLIKDIIELPSSKYTVINHNNSDELAIYDLWLMQSCKHFIIANSTFSWWGAWLSSNKEKIVIAPGFTLKEDKTWWGFTRLIPDEWIKL